MSVTFRIKASEAYRRRLDPEYHYALRRTRIRSTYLSAKLLLSYPRLRNWLSTDIYEREGKEQTNFARRACVPSSTRMRFSDHAGHIQEDFYRRSFVSSTQIKWQVVNRGDEAKGNLRGDFSGGNDGTDSKGPYHEEATAYSGTHYIVC